MELMTRNGNSATTWFPEIVSDVGKLKGDFIIDGEICIQDQYGRADFEALLKRLRPATRLSAKLPVVLNCFDLIFLNGEDFRSKPLLERKEALCQLVGKKQGRLLYVQHIEEKGEWLFQQAIEMGLEGILAKKADSKYVGGRSRNWLKSKPSKYHDGFKRPGRGIPPKVPSALGRPVWNELPAN